MKPAKLLGATLALSIGAVPVLAQTVPPTAATPQTYPTAPPAMPANPTPPVSDQSNAPTMAPSATPAMSAADKRKMERCQAMAHEAMMKDKACAALMKAHPEMMDSAMTPPKA